MDSIDDALVACVKALGGSKVMGPTLWPEKGAEAAQRLLLDCLNPERPAKLAPDQVMLILRMARQAGFHDGAAWMMENLGYAAPVPVDPLDNVAELMREYLAIKKKSDERAGMIERAMAVLMAQKSAGSL